MRKLTKDQKLMMLIVYERDEFGTFPAEVREFSTERSSTLLRSLYNRSLITREWRTDNYDNRGRWQYKPL